MIISTCTICGYNITDPICINCYKNELKYWTRENLHSKRIRTIIENVNFKPNDLGNDCIMCKKDFTSVCMYCYFHKIKSVLLQEKVSEDIIDSFTQTFNFEINDFGLLS